MIDDENGADQIIELLNSPDKLREMKENCIRLAKPDAARDMYNLAMELSGHAPAEDTEE